MCTQQKLELRMLWLMLSQHLMQNSVCTAATAIALYWCVQPCHYKHITEHQQSRYAVLCMSILSQTLECVSSHCCVVAAIQSIVQPLEHVRHYIVVYNTYATVHAQSMMRPSIWVPKSTCIATIDVATALIVMQYVLSVCWQRATSCLDYCHEYSALMQFMHIRYMSTAHT
jgi:hypothetical protein